MTCDTHYIQGGTKMSYTIEDFMVMTDEELIALWDEGVYLRPDEMNDYWRVREARNIEEGWVC